MRNSSIFHDAFGMLTCPGGNVSQGPSSLKLHGIRFTWIGCTDSQKSDQFWYNTLKIIKNVRQVRIWNFDFKISYQYSPRSINESIGGFLSLDNIFLACCVALKAKLKSSENTPARISSRVINWLDWFWRLLESCKGLVGKSSSSTWTFRRFESMSSFFCLRRSTETSFRRRRKS